MTRVIIIEDEELAAKRIKRLLSELNQPIEVVDVLGTVSDSLAFFKNHQPSIDLIFMDIHLGDGNSFEIFDQVEIVKPIIFITAYNQYALQAFKQLSIDYLLKPIQQNQLSQALLKYQQIYSNEDDNQELPYQKLTEILDGGEKKFKKRFLVTVGDKIRYINVKDIALFYAENKACFVISKEGKRYYVNYTLERLVPLLNAEDFLRVSRKVILNIEAVEEVLPYSKSKLLIKTYQEVDFEIFVSAEKIKIFKEWLNV